MTTDNITISRAALERIVGALITAYNMQKFGHAYTPEALLEDEAVIQASITEARAALEQTQGEESYWSEVIGMFVERLNHGPQTIAASDVLALLSDCQYLASLSRPQATEPAPERPINCGTGHCSCIECVMEPAPSTAGERDKLFEALRLAYDAMSGSTDKTLLIRAHKAVEAALFNTKGGL